MSVHGKKVLVVDDNANVLDSLTRMLALKGYQVTGASNAEQALGLYSKSFDLMISDLTLSGKSGLWLLSQVRERSSRMKFILMSGNPELRDLKDLTRFIRKPFKIEELLEVIEG